MFSFSDLVKRNKKQTQEKVDQLRNNFRTSGQQLPANHPGDEKIMNNFIDELTYKLPECQQQKIANMFNRESTIDRTGEVTIASAKTEINLPARLSQISRQLFVCQKTFTKFDEWDVNMKHDKQCNEYIKKSLAKIAKHYQVDEVLMNTGNKFRFASISIDTDGRRTFNDQKNTENKLSFKLNEKKV